MITFVLEMSLFNKFLPGNTLLEFIVIGFTICLIIYIYTLVCMYINKDNKNYYFIYNMLNINKCKVLKFYDKIIVLYEQNNEMHSMSLNYIINNMLDKNIEIIDNSDDTISSIYIDTLENKIIIEENQTAILVTHDISEAISMSNRIIILSKRPAHVKNIIEIEFPKKLSPFERRGHPNFGNYFNIIWEELKNEE